ncbi:L [Symbiodinium necroappetens]|uniref:Ubiquitin thioesterase OTU n=1 Tax=Symbiodinium necroappetens TaxID=1628268 RepID=A0A812K6S3_9DINO|nr:L [Symbiodinium necroappetens] [Symbiodinium necroappetens]|mmetsp:Transcript_59759/g.142590  ORF Transcript_59759/g.142590 Transcript_59759/m.142590 type:complete len:401 (-) Transcript_59759:53-1255(-)
MIASQRVPEIEPRKRARHLSPPKFQATKAELVRRAAEEYEFVTKCDTKHSEVYYLLCSQWLQQWKDFIRTKTSPPGAISNHNLVGADGCPKPNKQPIKDYRGVNEKVWKFWLSRYGGGPEIKRQKLELYQQKPQAPHPPPSKLAPKIAPVATMPSMPQPQPQPQLQPPPIAPAQPSQAQKRSGPAPSQSFAPSAPAPPAVGPQPRQFSEREKQKPAQKRKLTCDKCDGNHATEDCPHFKKSREQHPDAWNLVGKSHLVAASQADQKFVTRGRVVRQPGDGSCLFHALAFGLGGTSARHLREEAAQLIERQPQSQIIGTALQDWVKMDSGRTVGGYVNQLRRGAWGGGIELAVLAKSRKVMVEVYEARKGGFARIAKFGEGRKAVQVLYQGRLHYDALLLN